MTSGHVVQPAAGSDVVCVEQIPSAMVQAGPGSLMAPPTATEQEQDLLASPSMYITSAQCLKINKARALNVKSANTHA